MEVTDVQLVDALARRRLGLPAPPFTIHEVRRFYLYNPHHPSDLYDTLRGDDTELAAGCVYFFCDQIIYGDQNWKVASATTRVLDAGGSDVGCKLTLVYDEGRCVLQRPCWILDEFDAVRDYRPDLPFSDYNLRLYRLRRVVDAPPEQEGCRVGGFRRIGCLLRN